MQHRSSGPRRRVLAGLGVAVALMLAGCGSSSKTPAATPTSGSSSAAVTGTVTVLAASSLTGTFTQIGKDFEAANPGAKVTFSFGGSSTLAQQINQGAPADVFASASPTNMKQVADAGGVLGQSTTFAKNQLVIAVPKGNPKNIASLADLAKPGIKVAECAAAVPCGAAAKTAITAAGVTITPVTLEQDVKSALSKLTLGEVDAALVYRTDAIAAGDKVQGVEFPESAKAINQYPIAVLKNAPNPTGAKAFEAFVLTDKEIAVLTQAGFQKP
jgi:molybdate transport system substrate-binding protein